ncbi:Uncharacterised protein [Klebsiella quasipneumoniae]|nr:Uncharacterised protein [Klebsiella quasipneumoniae]
MRSVSIIIFLNSVKKMFNTWKKLSIQEKNALREDPQQGLAIMSERQRL